MHRTQLRNLVIIAGLGFSLSGCSFISGLFSINAEKKAEEEAAQARADEAAAVKAELEAKRKAALDPASSSEQMWEYAALLLEIQATKQEEAMGVDPTWMPELETALASRVEGAGGINADSAAFGYALVKIYYTTERYDESASIVLDMAKAGVEGPVPMLEMFDDVSNYPTSDVVSAAVLEMCPLVRPTVEDGSVAAFVSICVSQAGGDITKLSWESAVADLTIYARSSYAKGPASGTFTFESKLKGYKKSFWALGWVANTSAVYIGRPKVTAILVDGDGAEVGSYTGYAMIDEIPPGTRAPVSILINDPAKYADVRYEFAPEQADYLPQFVDGLSVEALKPRRTRYGWKVEGKVNSASEQSAQFVKVVIQALDAEGKLIGAQSTYVEDDKIEPGGTARWQTSALDVVGKPETFEYVVTGRVAD